MLAKFEEIAEKFEWYSECEEYELACWQREGWLREEDGEDWGCYDD
jgi:hypothetical protein